ncbi:hypothetical protein PARC_a3686 [Pseudoalteromonas arctica A 37-1-2]|uniref:Uncharacterized protein n=1 Tax=Pseudoalteromonas arctica A 37-1-2 TaxID=1117313 RepID=A0A290S7Z6_9GAMM|nr:hypothetical protein PARC_a3686 [Pseudoalteromonas arctica A 37-1-2]
MNLNSPLLRKTLCISKRRSSVRFLQTQAPATTEIKYLKS